MDLKYTYAHEWPENDERSVDGTCDHCERETIIQNLDEPFDECYPELGEDAGMPNVTSWCYECWSNRNDEI